MRAPPSLAELIAEWRRREADVKALDNRTDLSTEEDDKITGLAFDAFRAVKEAPAANVNDMLLKLRCVAEVHRGKALTDDDAGALSSFLQVLLEDAERCGMYKSVASFDTLTEIEEAICNLRRGTAALCLVADALSRDTITEQSLNFVAMKMSDDAKFLYDWFYEEGAGENTAQD